MKERIKWIDYSKAILIYLVVLAHYGQINSHVDELICAFHMPAFFFISGYLHKGSEIKMSVKKNTQRLLIPALCFSLICMAFSALFSIVIKHEAFSLNEHIVKPLLGIIRYDRPNAMPPCGVIWFLEVLFICNVLADLVKKNIYVLISLTVICIVATCFLESQNIVMMSYGFIPQRFLASFPFIFAGMMFKQFDLLEKNFKKYVVGIALLVLYVLAVWGSGHTGIASWNFGDGYYLFLLKAVIGSLAFFWIMNLIAIKQFNLIVKISINTIVILCLHRMMIPFINKIPFMNAYLGSLIIVGICIPLMWLFEKYAPWIIGRNKVIK